MIKAMDIVALFQKALAEHWGYIWGQAGTLWTEAQQKAATREQTVKYGKKWIGHYVADCSGMFSWAFKKLGGYMYHGSNTMWKKYMVNKGALAKGKRIDGQELKPGTAVFKNSGTNYYHVGLYIGNGTVIEAKGTSSGVVTSAVSTWHAWGEMKGVDYGDVTDTVTPEPAEPAEPESPLGTRLLKRTSPYMRGDDVKVLQSMLNVLGFDCGAVDGIFGDKTKAGVKAFQQAKGLVVDGIVGPKTKAALLAA